jgi:hypothetical protein
MKTETLKHEFFTDAQTYLRDLLIERKHRNPNYSANAMARDLELSAPFLSQVISGKRNLSLSQKLKLADRLNLDSGAAQEHKKFELVQTTLEHDKIIRYWYHFAILELCQTPKTSADPASIAETLQISEVEAKSALSRLAEFGYIQITRARTLKRTKTPFIFNAKHTTVSVRALHQSRLHAAVSELETFNTEQVAHRNFQTIFVATSRSRVAEAKRMTDEFTQKLMKHLTDGEGEEVFQYSTQLFSAEKTPNQTPNSTKLPKGKK